MPVTSQKVVVPLMRRLGALDRPAPHLAGDGGAVGEVGPDCPAQAFLFAALGRAGRNPLVCARRSVSPQHRPCSITSTCQAPSRTMGSVGGMPLATAPANGVGGDVAVGFIAHGQGARDTEVMHALFHPEAKLWTSRGGC